MYIFNEGEATSENTHYRKLIKHVYVYLTQWLAGGPFTRERYIHSPI